MYSFIYNVFTYSLSTLGSTNLKNVSQPRFKKSLVYKLMCKHQDLLQLFVEMKLCAQMNDNHRAIQILRKFNKVYEKQVSIELSEVYAFIIFHDSENCLAETLGEIQQNTAKVDNDIRYFCAYWQEKLLNPSSDDDFYTALDILGKSLDALITEKEMKLYPLYNQSSIRGHKQSTAVSPGYVSEFSI